MAEKIWCRCFFVTGNAFTRFSSQCRNNFIQTLLEDRNASQVVTQSTGMSKGMLHRIQTNFLLVLWMILIRSIASQALGSPDLLDEFRRDQWPAFIVFAVNALSACSRSWRRQWRTPTT